jgi:type IV pilus assembly protein PilA
MLQKYRNILKNEKGLTLIELLAVVVILGIISAIAVPSIGGLIDNSKKDAHVANAQQMVSSARLAITADSTLLEVENSYLTLAYLVKQEYLESVSDPDGGSYKDGGTGSNEAVQTTEPGAKQSYVVITNGKVTAVKLFNGKRGIRGAGNTTISVSDITRNNVR